MKYKQIPFIIGFILLFLGCSQSEKDNSVEWEKEAAGVWKIKAGSPDKINLLSELAITPKYTEINSLGEIELPISKDEIRFEWVDGKTYIRFPLDENEQIFGLGLHFKTVDQRGRILRLHVDHYGDSDNGRTHAPVPFFVSSRGYGALINVARYIDVWVGTGVRKDSKSPPVVRDRNTDKNWEAQPYSDNLEILVPAEGAEIILFGGANMQEVVQRYNLYNGGGVLPPRWGLGFWHRVPTLYTAGDVEKEVSEFEERNFPLTVIGLEPGWMSHSYPCTYEWDKNRFPDPEKFVANMEKRHIKTNLWVNPYVSPTGELFDKIDPYTASHTVWCGTIPDYSMPEARNILKEHFEKHHLSIGVSGYKMDENDGYDYWLWPDVATFPSGHTGEQMRQIYGSLMMDMTTQMYREKNQRTYGLARAANAGTTSYPYVLYNDYYNHRDFITALINSSFIGVLWTPEVRASKTSEEWLRRMQTVCFSPLAMLNAWADGTKPWSFNDVSKDVDAIAKLRMQLIPYLYTAFADYTFYGIPPIRAMVLEEGFVGESEIITGDLHATDNPYAMAARKESKDQFMVGPSLLVAPLFAGETSREVILPKGNWYDFYTGEYVGNGESITVVPGLSRIPVYVKEGGIIPLYPPLAKLDGQKYPLEIRCYGNQPSSYSLYDDDGETYNYENGDFVRIELKYEVSDDKKDGAVTIPEGKVPWSFSAYNFRYMTP